MRRVLGFRVRWVQVFRSASRSQAPLSVDVEDVGSVVRDFGVGALGFRV